MGNVCIFHFMDVFFTSEILFQKDPFINNSFFYGEPLLWML